MSKKPKTNWRTADDERLHHKIHRLRNAKSKSRRSENAGYISALEAYMQARHALTGLRLNPHIPPETREYITRILEVNSIPWGYIGSGSVYTLCNRCQKPNLGNNINCDACAEFEPKEYYEKPPEPEPIPRATTTRYAKCPECGGRMTRSAKTCIGCYEPKPVEPGSRHRFDAKDPKS